MLNCARYKSDLFALGTNSLVSSALVISLRSKPSDKIVDRRKKTEEEKKGKKEGNRKCSEKKTTRRDVFFFKHAAFQPVGFLEAECSFSSVPFVTSNISPNPGRVFKNRTSFNEPVDSSLSREKILFSILRERESRIIVRSKDRNCKRF